MVDCGRQMLRYNGITGLYQGLSPHLLRNIPAGSLYFGVYENIRLYYAEQLKLTSVSQLPSIYPLMAGGAAGVVYWGLIFPVDVIKSSFQTDNIDKSKRRYKGIVSCALDLYKNEGGWKRFYRGFAPCMMRSIPANSLMLFTVNYVTEAIPILKPTPALV